MTFEGYLNSRALPVATVPRNNNNNNNNMLAYKAPVCQKTSEALNDDESALVLATVVFDAV